MGISIEGLDKLNKLLDSIDRRSESNLMQEFKAIAEDISTDARMLAPVQDGRLRNSIDWRVTKDNRAVAGEVFSQLNYARYVEFGTGIKGAEAGLVRDGVNLTYTMQPWVIPASKMSKETAEQYHFIPIKKNGEVIGYLCHGAKPHPFLYPALQQNKDKIVKISKKAVLKME